MLLKVALDWEIIDELPCRITMLPIHRTEMSFFEYADYARLVAAAGKIDARIHLMVLLGGDAGLRRGEMTSLRVSDVDLRRKQITIRRAEWQGIEDDTKGRGARVVPLTVALHGALQNNRHLRSDRVLTPDDGSALTANDLERWMRSGTTRAGPVCISCVTRSARTSLFAAHRPRRFRSSRGTSNSRRRSSTCTSVRRTDSRRPSCSTRARPTSVSARPGARWPPPRPTFLETCWRRRPPQTKTRVNSAS